MIDNIDTPEINVPPAMIERGLAFIETTVLPTLTSSVAYPDFVESFLSLAINGGCSRKDSASA